jgi:hypothetical protein
MKTWEERFFDLNRTNQIELVGVPLEHVARALYVLRWIKDDQFWAPDLHVTRFHRGQDEIFVIQETYFDPKLTGTEMHVEEIREIISGIDPSVRLYAGAQGKIGDDPAEQAGTSNGG